MNYDLSVSELQQLPEKLDEENIRLEHELLDWSTQHSGLLLQSRTLSHSIDKNLTALRNLTNTLSSTSKYLRNDFSLFHQYGFHKGRKKMHRNLNTLRQYPDILRILELPQLMRTCVSSERYDEAIDLKEFSDHLLSQQPTFPVLQEINASCTEIMTHLINKLLHTLKYDDSVPRVMTVFPLLRKLNVMEEVELKEMFLRFRSSFVFPSEENSRGANNSEPVGFRKLLRLSDTITHPLRLFVFQYQTLFSSSSSSSSYSTKSNIESNKKQKEKQEQEQRRRSNFETDFLLVKCLYERILTPYLQVMERGIQEIQHFEQITMLVSNISKNVKVLVRIGLEFTPILKTMVFDRVLLIMKERIYKLQVKFQENLKEKNIKKNEGILKMVNQDILSEDERKLMTSYENAQLVNDFLLLFNELKNCIPDEENDVQQQQQQQEEGNEKSALGGVMSNKMCTLIRDELRQCRKMIKEKIVENKKKIKKQKVYFGILKNFDHVVIDHLVELMEKIFEFDLIQKQEIINYIKEIKVLNYDNVDDDDDNNNDEEEEKKDI